MMTDKEGRSGFAVLLGRPNVGKSSLVNALVGTKVAIVSPKPQTTRRRIQAVLTVASCQVVFVDTPGVQRAGDCLGRNLARAAVESLTGVDAALFVVDAVRKRGREDMAVAEMLRPCKAAKMLVVNKIDLVDGDDGRDIERIRDELGFNGPAMAVSALTGRGVAALGEWVINQMPPGPKYFPDGMLTDQPEQILAAEMVREQILLRLGEEVPHDSAVLVEEMTRRPGGKLYIRGIILVERPGQRAIIIGAGGKRLREIGREARVGMEKVFGESVYLDLWVKVEKDWRNKAGRLQELGYE